MIKKFSAFLLVFALAGLSFQSTGADAVAALFKKQNLGTADAVLVVNSQGEKIYSWQADKPLVPASLAKLATAHIAIKAWGLDKRFETHFYRVGHTLWVKGFGDPYLVSEEIELISEELLARKLSWLNEIAIDGSYFKDQSVPGRSKVADPYNAPLAAVSANFNTAQLRNVQGVLHSDEAQTPLTTVAMLAAKRLGRPASGKAERVNLINADNAQRNFAQILAAKLGKPRLEVTTGGQLPVAAKLVYRHKNTRTLADIIRGTLEFSNNFMANQVFLMLAEKPKVEFGHASKLAHQSLKSDFAWQHFRLKEGAGLSRDNRLSAQQLDDLLASLAPEKELFKSYLADSNALVRAKTGTLNGVRSFAGYIELGQQEYRFVFNFNREVPYRYRETLLEKLVASLSLKG